MRRLLAHRDARLYLAGQTLSAVGDGSLWLAMGIWVKMLTGSSSAAGLVFFALTAGLLVAPVSGVIVDRLARRPLLVAVNAASAGLVCVLLLVSGQGGVWLIYLVMFGYGISTTLIASAQTALLPAIVPADLLGDANAALQMGSQGLRVFTPLLGAGLLAAIGPAPVILLDAGSFLAAAAAVLALRLREAPRPPAGRDRAESRWSELAAGLRHIGRTPDLRRLLTAGMIALLVIGFFETVSFTVVGDGLHRSAPFLGVLITVQGAGALAGGVVAAPLMRRTGERIMVALGLAACALACLLLMAAWLAMVLAGAVLLGICIMWVNVGAITLVQRRTPAALIGRVDAALTTAITVPQAVSIALGAALVAVVDYRILLATMALVLAASVVYLAAGRPEAEVELSGRGGAAGQLAGNEE